MVRYPAERGYAMTLEQFLKNVHVEGECWLWTGAKNAWSGYGRVAQGRKEYQAQELSWMLHRGSIPIDLPYVRQHCRNRACVNPDHLYLAEMREGTIAEAFWARVKKSEACWLWIGERDNRGYGRLEVIQWHGQRRERVHHRASRISWELHFGSPGDLYVCHHCDNPVCVRPDHLFLGTQFDNMQDMVQKKRGRYRRGSEHPLAKLSQKDVDTMRRRYAIGNVSYRELAEEYHVSKQLVYRIMKRKNWADS